MVTFDINYYLVSSLGLYNLLLYISRRTEFECPKEGCSYKTTYMTRHLVRKHNESLIDAKRWRHRYPNQLKQRSSDKRKRNQCDACGVSVTHFYPFDFFFHFFCSLLCLNCTTFSSLGYFLFMTKTKENVINAILVV